ncbi:cystathionine gamma-synthase family protein [Candidatus Korarchaeum cryptofilum]|jgi:cystathionine gamma-synthase|uniref:Cystathionine gamma-synthase family protein n=1 Tax=Candidatus Korarchaeum cryptofilum TaxID=498846 RepID=A0A3R9QRY5_9CREN|nr:PLP-dependent transferase [Candidatus Korarchaeum cryptofilum]RSN70605.1 cystathionine gamma-synthase family protein [Candidatus Korarchaeum cryptofilum]
MSDFSPIEVPIYMTATFQNPLPSGKPNISRRGKELKYSREENPTVEELERIVASLDGYDDCLAFNSGMASISTLFLSRYRKRIVVNLDSYSATVGLALRLKAMGFDIEICSTDHLGECIKPGSLVFTESITNPLLRVPDLEMLRDSCIDKGAEFIIDNTSATPVLLKPSLFSDLSIQSATKYLSGTNDTVGGVVSGNELSELWEWRRVLGSILDPFRAFLIIRGVKTLELRMRRHCETALTLARWLQDHPKVKEVIYPGLETHKDHQIAKRLLKGFGGIISFRINGDARKFLMNLRKIKRATSFGASISLASIPHESASSNLTEDLIKASGIDGSLIRLSVGLEDPEILIEDLDSSLKGI